MKKALVILMALSMVFAAFADEPAVVNELAEFKGDATVTWGVDLDAGKTGFKNETSASLKFNLVSQGSKATTGEGIWGEIAVKLDTDDGIRYTNDGWNGAKVKVDKAKLHINDMIAIGILSGDNKYGEYKPTLAVFSDKKHFMTSDVGGTVTDGITLEITLDKLLDLNIDFRSLPDAFAYTGTLTEPTKVEFDGTNVDAYNTYLQQKESYDKVVAYYKGKFKENYYTNNYGIGTQVALKAVDNLNFKVGFGIDFFGSNPWGLSVSTDYKLALSDTMYLLPQVGFTMTNADKSGEIVGTLLVGWGKENQDTNIKWISKKVSDGFSVSTTIPFDSDKAIPLCVGVWDSTFVENLTAGAQFHVKNLKDFAANTLACEFSYKLGDITPIFAFAMDNGGDLGWSDALKIYAAVKYTGFANTTITLAYESGDLKTSKAGTINLSTKIAF